MVTIRLMRIGKKHNPSYRIVVQESRRKTNGLYLDAVGLYRPKEGDGGVVQVDHDKVRRWRARGASISSAVRSLLKRTRPPVAA